VSVFTGTLALLGLLAAYGGAFIENVTIPRTFSANLLGTNLGCGVSKTIIQLLGFAVVAATVSIRRDEAITFAGLYIAAALLSIVAFGGAEGVWINVSMDLMIAVSIAFGLVWDRAGLFKLPAAGQEPAQCLRSTAEIADPIVRLDHARREPGALDPAAVVTRRVRPMRERCCRTRQCQSV